MLALVALAGCGPVKLVANTNIPTPLVVKIPIAVALFIPKEFSTYVHNEERWSTDWHVELGKAQTDGITRLDERDVRARDCGRQRRRRTDAADNGVRAILEPSVEEFAFVTPRDAGSPFFAVSIKYRVNVYLPNGKLADSWGFTGYGTAPAEGLSSAPPLQTATALAMRDAGRSSPWNFASRPSCGVCCRKLQPPTRSRSRCLRSLRRRIPDEHAAAHARRHAQQPAAVRPSSRTSRERGSGRRARSLPKTSLPKRSRKEEPAAAA